MRRFGWVLVVAACRGTDPQADGDDGDADPLTHDTDPGVGGAADTDAASPADGDTDGGASGDTDAGAGTCGVCDDSDPCTTDACEAGVCTFRPWDGDPYALWDLAAARDPSTLDLDLISTGIVLDGLDLIRVDEIRFTSFESEGCELRPVRLEAYVAMPASSVGRAGSLAGLVVAHGLGQFATDGAVMGPAADLGTITIAYSGPGQGLSEGTPSTSDHLFDTVDSPRDSWFWEHAYAAMRAITVLDTYAETDPSRIGMTGYSGGAVATLMVSGLDDRVIAAVPVSGTGHLDRAIGNTPPGWELDLLRGMVPPRDAASPEWAGYQQALDPARYLATTRADVLLIDGAQDEFFPLVSLAPTFADLVATGGTHRLLTIRDWDHGWFALFNSVGPTAWTDEALQHWFRHFLRLGGASKVVPLPQMGLVADGICSAAFAPCLYAQATLPPTGMAVLEAKVHFSTDGLAWFDADLEDRGALGWIAELPFLSTADWGTGKAAWYAEFVVREGLLGDALHTTSAPLLPPGFQAGILPIQGPIP